MGLCCCVLRLHMVSATSRIWCKSWRGGSLLTTLWKSWLVHQVRGKLFSLLKWCRPRAAWLFTSLRSGCLNGGGQLKALPGQNPKELLQKVEEIYRAERSMLPEDNNRVAELYQSWLCSVGEERAKELLHTQYHTVEKMTNGLAMKWWPIPVAMGDHQTGYWSIYFALTIQISEWRRLSLLTKGVIRDDINLCGKSRMWAEMSKADKSIPCLFSTKYYIQYLQRVKNKEII